MNYFEQELRRIAKACTELKSPVFAGRACYGDLGGDNRVKLQFVTQGIMDNYEALKATILNRSDGEVDSLVFRFKDTWGKKYDHGYKDGTPYIWTYQGKSEWYAYRPTDSDMKKLGAEIGGYIAMFTDRPLMPERPREQQSVIKTIRESKLNAARNANAPPPKKKEREI